MSDHNRDERYSLGPSTNVFSTALPDGTGFPEHLLGNDGRPLPFLKQFDRVRDKPWSDCRIIDLGCNEGNSSFNLAQTGAYVIGVEGREDAVQRAKYIQKELNVSNLELTF